MRVVFRSSPGAWVVAVPALLLAACTYSPKIDDGTLGCGPDGECPSGYSCRIGPGSVPRCYDDNGPGPGALDGGGGGGDGGIDAVPIAVLNRYLGDWAFGTDATVKTQCDDGFSDTTSLSGSGDMTVIKGPAGIADLTSQWLCDIYLGLDANGAHLRGSHPACTGVSSDQKTDFTWTAASFEFKTADGLTAQHAAKYNRLDEWTDGTVVHCTQDVAAVLTKN